MRIILILCILILTACGPREAPLACTLVEMSIPYEYSQGTPIKSDLHQCVYAAGEKGRTCLVYRAVNQPELYSKSCF